MLQSMTGFGAGKAPLFEDEVLVEIKSVNNKGCEVRVRLPKEMSSLEAYVTKRVKETVSRGSVDVFVKRQRVSQSTAAPKIDLALAQAYHMAYRDLAKALGMVANPSLRDIAMLDGVLRLEAQEVSADEVTPPLEAALKAALTELKAMRQKEGEALKKDLSSRLAQVERVVNEVVTLAPQSVEAHREKLKKRVQELLGQVPVDEVRLVQEVAIMAERVDVAEEMTRLHSHFVQFRDFLNSKESVGRKLDFLVQEMHREVNTTGSKSQSSEISSRVVFLKAEIERLKEQVQNVE